MHLLHAVNRNRLSRRNANSQTLAMPMGKHAFRIHACSGSNRKSN
jgi:hypothetical protein